MEITKANYFEKVTQLGVGYLPPAMTKMHELIRDITNYGKDWSKYDRFKSAWDKQFLALGKLLEQKDKRGTEEWKKVGADTDKKTSDSKRTSVKSMVPKEKVSEEEAHRAAIKLIEHEVINGESYESIKRGQQGHHSNLVSAHIKAAKIIVEQVDGKKCNFSFSLQRIYNEIKNGITKKDHKPISTKQKHGKKPHFVGKGVELVAPEVIFIKRFALLHGKEKNRQQVLNFVKAIQKAIVERKIRKGSKYAKVIQYIQEQLVKAYNSMSESISFSFSQKDHLKYLKMAGAEYLLPSVRFIKSYIGMLGQNITKQRAGVLYEKIMLALENKVIQPSDKYMKHLKIVLSSLDKFLKSGATPHLSEAQLNGLEGVLESCGCNLHGAEYDESYGSALNGVEDSETTKAPHNTILNSKDVLNLKTEKLDFQGKWRDFIGNPSKGFTMMVYGKPKFGKSYLAVDFAGYLARNHGRVLYVAREEGFDDTLQEKLREKGVADENLDVADHLPKNLSNYQFVFLDSINRLELSPDDIRKLEQKYPDISFVYIFQTNKGGDFKGSMEFKHNVDSVIEVPEKGLAIQYGRYNQGGEMRIFNHPS